MAKKSSWLLAGGVLVLAALAAYWNSFSVPFFFDDPPAITENRTIRQLWPVWTALSPPSNVGVGGRPLVNLSLAVNYAAGGAAVRGYHLLNLAIHVLAGLTFFGVMRRTLLQPVLSTRFGAVAPLLALEVAFLWTVHPLQTESVTCVVQRTESLMGLFYLLTLYCFIRGLGDGAAAGRRFDGLKAPSQSRGWQALAVASCWLGMASKEVMVSAPLMVLLYDRTFAAGSFREAWRRRRRLYLGLAGSWLLLGCLVVSTGGNRGGAAGFGRGITWWGYALTQCQAIVHYLRLSVWPHPLIVDYGTDVVKTAAEVAPQALLLALLVAGTAWGLRRRPVLGFAGAWFFAILAPSSSVVPLATQTVAEHRMYLPLAAVLGLLIPWLYALAGWRCAVACLALAAGWGGLTSRRNGDYRSELVIWSKTAAQCPGNPRAHNNLGFVLAQAGRVPEAVAQYEEALRLKPDYPEAHNNFGSVLAKVGRIPEAISQYDEALRLKPDYPEAYNNLGNVLAQAGRMAEAMEQSGEALRLKPDFAEAHSNLGNDLLQMNRVPEAVRHYEEALRLKPDFFEAHYNLGNALLTLGRVAEAIGHYEETLRFKPGDAEVHSNLGTALFQAGRVPEALQHFEEALRLRPNEARMHFNMADLLARIGRVSEAIGQYEEVLRLKPDFVEARNDLARLRALQQASGPGK